MKKKLSIGSSVLIVSLCFGAGYSCPVNKSSDAPAGKYSRELLLLRDKGLKEEGAFRLLARLTGLGPRLTGSPGAAEAVQLTRRIMTEMGLDQIRLEPTRVGRWERGPAEEARLISSSGESSELNICSLGGSIPTAEKGLSAGILEVKSFEELEQKKSRVAGHIIFFNRPMDRTDMDTFRAYSRAADQRVRGAVEAAKAGATAVLVRSLTTRLDDFPHTGVLQYRDDVEKIPAAAISTRDAERLSSALSTDPACRVFLKLNCRNHGMVISHNVMGQITGTEFLDEIILLGGHLDSWYLGTGAHDDGAGCVHALEALRLLKELGLEPSRRTTLF